MRKLIVHSWVTAMIVLPIILGSCSHAEQKAIEATITEPQVESSQTIACTKNSDCDTYYCDPANSSCGTRDYLRPGQQTIPGKFITKNLANIDTENKTPQDAIKAISRWISSAIMHSDFNKNISLSNSEKGSSTAEEMVALKKHAKGCTDFDVMFVTFARAKGYPAIYVNTFALSFIEQLADGIVPEKVTGHDFAIVKFDGEWHAYDPVGETFFEPVDDQRCGEEGCFVRGGSELYKVTGEGLDFWDLGFKNISESNSAMCASYGLTCN